ncbi:MAG: tetratricopeptide repeat protein [Omnitrophica bacterium]|nr:tetratricopeptide repeat protein [Candidatus Omnitrophota bacterium]
MRNSSVVLIIICAALLCYANALGAPFLWDDEVLIIRNHYIKNFTYLREIFTTTHFQGGGEGGNFYRPLQIISYLFDYTLWKLNPFGYHLTNLILHCLVGIVAYFLISKISADRLTGFLSALFFMVHPVHTEAVAYISGRADSLTALFLLSAFLMFIKIPTSPGKKRKFYWVSAFLLYIFALLSKESALIFSFLIFFYGLCFVPKKKIKPWIPIYASFLLLSVVYVLIRVAIFGFPQITSLSLIAQAPALTRLLTIPKIALSYLGLLILPIHLHMERHFLVNNMADPYFRLGLVVLFFTVWLLKLTYRRWRSAFFYLGWFIITLIPVLNLVPLNATMAEHWLYLPAVGFLALATTAGVKLFREGSEKTKKIILALTCLLFLFYCPRTIMRNFQWRNPLKLYAHDLKYSPKSFILHNNLGVELFRWGEIEGAGREFQAAVALSPRYATSHNNLGVVLENQDKIEEAIAHYQAAIQLNNYILAFGNLGRVYLKTEQPAKAAAVLEKGQKLYPDDPEIIYHLSRAYKILGTSDLK